MTARRRRPLAAGAVLAALATLASLTVTVPAQASPPGNTVRFATYNASLNRNVAGQLIQDLATPNNTQAANVAEVIQRERPDVLLINEFDFDAGGVALARFQDNYLSVPHNGAAAIDYPYAFTAPSNTGIASGFDLNNFGGVVTTPGAPGYGDDALGFGAFPGQFGMAVYSKYPIDEAAVRTFQNFLWKDMPGNSRCRPEGLVHHRGAGHAARVVQVALGPADLDRQAHRALPGRATRPRRCSTAPRTATAGATSTRSGCGPTTSRRARAATSTTTQGVRGGLAPGESFVIAGDQNSDPLDGDSIPGSIQQLIDSPLRQHLAHAGERGCRRGVGAAGWGQPDTPLGPAVRHGRLQ